ncbi:hypothetical protein ONS96_006782 [Cadophora gregata f. sp. sojae]|nr:hypothetical protein ONS96_006782 [Cadophora gregata f. sp. sojae]
MSRFATEHHHDPDIDPPLLLESLGPEILVMIFDQIYITKPATLISLRLTCRRINQIVAPLSYRRVHLSVRKLAAVSGRNKREDIVRNVYAHTRHVEFRQLLDWDDVALLLFGCVQLDTITWACGRDILQCYFPNAMRLLVGDKWPRVRISNEFLDYPAIGQSGSFLKTFPASNMISLTLHNRVPRQSNRPLHQFLATCVNLEELRLYGLNFLDSIFEPADGRLPAIKSFFTDVRSWPYTQDNVHSVWDFSQLQDLEIAWHVFGFMSQSMSPENLSRLRRLRLRHRWAGIDSPIEVYTQYHTMRTSFLNSILERIPENQLQELDVKCHLPKFSTAALARHGRSLRLVRLLDASGFEVDGSTTSTTSLDDLTRLHFTCPHLTEVAVGVNIAYPEEIPAFADSMSGFRNLSILTLYMQKVPKSFIPVTGNKVLDFGQCLAERLYKQKFGLSLSKLSINVGEWTPRSRPHRLIHSSKANLDMTEAYQPRRFLNFSWDLQGLMLFETEP